MSRTQRLDLLLVERGLAESRAKAQALIMAGKVRSGDRVLDKPGQGVPGDIDLALDEPEHPWVSRGGQKLAHGLQHFGLSPAGLVCLDIGASTGGFTDVLLQAGAAKVYAVDVGHGQLDWRLRQDARVVVLERTNARHLTADQIPEPVQAIVCDASFIGLRTVLPAALALTAPGLRRAEAASAAQAGAWLVALVKPQFEVGKDKVGKSGVVRDPALHAWACETISQWLAEQGWTVLGTTESPITGPKGNREFLIAARR